MGETSGRARVAPRERFAGTEKCFRLEEEFSRLPGQSRVLQGHCQKALYRHGPVTTAIFTFEANGQIHEHRAEGESIIHVIEGTLFVTTQEGEYTLGANELLLLDPGVRHQFRAVEPTRLLLTFVLLNDGRQKV